LRRLRIFKLYFHVETRRKVKERREGDPFPVVSRSSCSKCASYVDVSWGRNHQHELCSFFLQLTQMQM
jgi:hypothetical protein